MDFLNELALPQSLEHFHLVVLIAGLSALVFIPYLAIALGSAYASLRLNRVARRENNPTAMQFARGLVDVAFFSKGLVAFLGVIPGLSLVFALAQILHETPSIAVSLAGVGFLFFLAGSALMYAYRYTFRIRGLLDAYQSLIRKLKADNHDGLESYSESNLHAHLRSGRYGAAFLLAAAMLYVAAVGLAADPDTWGTVESFVEVLAVPGVWARLALFAAFTVAATGLSILFFTFAWTAGEHGDDEAYAQIARRHGIRLSVAGLLALPVLVLLNLFSLSGAALAGVVYALAGAALIFMFIAAHFLYAHVHSASARTAAAAFFAFLLAGSLLVINDFVGIGFATRTQAVTLAAEHDKETEALRSQLGISIVTFTGLDIYNNRCSSCHLFDQKKVGPPYRETLPKYQGKKAELIAFILNPVKKNPDYPSMPNPGLRPAEADSVASYLLSTVRAATPAQ